MSAEQESPFLFPRLDADQLQREREWLAHEVARWMTQDQRPGDVLLRHRDWPPPWPAWVVVVGVWLPLLLVPAEPRWSMIVVYLFMVLISASLVVATGLGYVVEVREQAVVLSSRVPWAGAAHVLPLWSIDPSRIRWHLSSPAMQRRVGGHLRGSPLIGLSPMFRAAIWSRTAVSLEGHDLDAAGSGRVRFHPSANITTPRVMRVGGAGWPLFGDPVPIGLTPYVLSTRRPEALIGAIERAMTAQGRSCVEGLTDRLVTHPVRERVRRPLTDEQVYGPSGSAYPWSVAAPSTVGTL